MKISKAELKKIIAEELDEAQKQFGSEEEYQEFLRKRGLKDNRIDGTLYPLPLRMLYKMFGLDEGHDFREAYADQVRALLMKKKDNTITPEEEDELTSLLNRPELMEESILAERVDPEIAVAKIIDMLQLITRSNNVRAIVFNKLTDEGGLLRSLGVNEDARNKVRQGIIKHAMQTPGFLKK
tara:strand:- start:315 stop:860 length:546 start_codon:yes stop_codon:yes gene_type:complete